MNKYLTIINLLKELNNQLNNEWNEAHEAFNNSTYENDKKYYDEIKNRINDLQALLDEQIKEME